MQTIFNAIDTTINKSAINDFKEFINKFDYVTKWFMCSDYCLNDKNKPNDVMSFVLFPYIMNFDKWFSSINSLQKTDFKKTRTVSDKFCNFLKSGYIFSFNFIIEKDSRINKWRDVCCLKKAIDDYISMINNQWKVSTPHNVKHYCTLVYKLENLKTEMNKKSFNYTLLSKIFMVTFFASYIRYLLIRETSHVDIFSWLPDRDKMMNFNNSVYEILYEITSYCLCYNTLPESKYTNIKDMIPCNIETNIFYDEVVRVADFICGTIADYNLKTNEVTKSKHCIMLENAIADNPNILILDLNEKWVARVCSTLHSYCRHDNLLNQV